MPEPTSAPTARVLDVLELLSRPGIDPLRFTDVARELGLAQGTANSILSTLTARGWVERDPQDKRYTIGAALSLIAVRVQSARALGVEASTAVRRLAEETGMLSSLAERVGDDIAILAYEGGEAGGLRGSAGDSIPYAPPYGLTFAAWAGPDEQSAWMARATESPEVEAALGELLVFTRERGYSVEWMTDVMAEVAELLPALGAARAGSVSTIMRRVMDELLIDYLGPRGQRFKTAPDRKTPVIVISAPVFDGRGQVAFTLTLHPLKPLTKGEIAKLGDRLTKVCAGLSAAD